MKATVTEYRFSDNLTYLLENLPSKLNTFQHYEQFIKEYQYESCRHCKSRNLPLQYGFCGRCISFQELSRISAIRWIHLNELKYKRRKKICINEEHTFAYIPCAF